MQAVIGAFDNAARVQQALDRLEAAGFDPEDIHVERQDSPTLSSGNRGIEADPQAAGKRHTGIAGFFASLFTSEDQANTGHAHTYEEAVRRGSSVVVVNTDDDAQAERACAILHEVGAVDVDERSRQWVADGWHAGQGGAAGSHPLDRGGVRVFPRRP